MNGARPQSSRQRVRDPGPGQSSGEAVVRLEISVESLSLRDAAKSGAQNRDDDDDVTSDQDNRIAYIRAVYNFRRLVLSDFDRTLTKVGQSLTASYGCRSVRAASAAGSDRSAGAADDDDGMSVVLELRQPRARMVSLQCDHSGGYLCRELQRLLVTDAVVSALGLSELTINTDIRTVD